MNLFSENCDKKLLNDKELANLCDSIKDINGMMKHSFLACQQNPEETDCVIKIIYWASFYKNYDDVMKLLEIIKNNQEQLKCAKITFLRENKITIKEFLIKKYINLVKQKESLHKNRDIDVIDDINDNVSVSDHLTKFYDMISNIDIYCIFDECIREKKYIQSFQ